MGVSAAGGAARIDPPKAPDAPAPEAPAEPAPPADAQATQGVEELGGPPPAAETPAPDAPAPAEDVPEPAPPDDAPKADERPAPEQPSHADVTPKADEAQRPSDANAPEQAPGADPAPKADPSRPANDAGNLDAEVPAEQLPARVQEQLDTDAKAAEARTAAEASGADPEAAAREVYTDFYGERDVYVDPTTQRAYAATYDPATGELVGTRTGDRPLPDLPRPADDPGNPTPDSTTATTTVYVVPGTNDSRVVQDDEQVREDGAVVTTKRERTVEDFRVTDASEVERTETPDGRAYDESRVESFDAVGQPERVEQEWRATEDDVVLVEQHDTTYQGGLPTAKTIDRSMDIRDRLPGMLDSEAFGVQRQQDVLSYDAQGKITGIASDYPEGDGQRFNQSLNALRDDGDGTQARFAFGGVEGRPHTDDEGNAIPGLVSGPGATVTHRGVNVVVEGANPSRDLPADAQVDTSPEDASLLTNDERLQVAREQVSQTPPELLDTQGDTEGGLSVRYMTRPGESGAFAWRAEDGIVFPNGNLGSTDPLWHELAHDSKNPTDEQYDRWEAIQRTDGEHRDGVIDSLPDGTRVQASRADLLNSNLGVTGYGDKDRGEDWADSVMLYERSQRDGGIVKAELPDGSTRLITFEELFPERAALIREVHPEIDAWTPPTADPSWTDTDRFGADPVGTSTKPFESSRAPGSGAGGGGTHGGGTGSSDLGSQARDGAGALSTGAPAAPAMSTG